MKTRKTAAQIEAEKSLSPKDYILLAIKDGSPASLKYELGQLEGFYAVQYINELVADGDVSWHEVSVLMNKASKI